MAKKKARKNPSNGAGASRASSTVEELLIAALERGDESYETGRYLVTFKEGAGEQGLQSLAAQGMLVADARDFEDQAAVLESVGDADAVVFPEIGVALLGGDAAHATDLSVQAEIATDSPIHAIEPEYFMFAQGDFSANLQGGFTQTAERENTGEYMRGFLRAAETIAKDLRGNGQLLGDGEEALVLGATWGLNACRVAPSVRSGVAVKVATLDSGMAMGHPDFAGRPIVGQTFVGQPVQDLFSHGTHMIGTACGPRSPAGNIPRYGIAFRSLIFAGKILSNSGSSVGGSVLAGMNWAIANRCPVILAPIGVQLPAQVSYTAMGQAALNNGCLIIAGAGHSASGNVSAPANSPTIMSVAALDPNLSPSSFSNFGKIEIAAPGRDVFSSVPLPPRYRSISGTATAAAHVAGCAALWAEISPNLRGMDLWRKLQAAARRLSFPATRVGAGLVQAP